MSDQHKLAQGASGTLVTVVLCALLATAGALRANGEDARLNEQGLACLGGGDYVGAERCFRRAIELNPRVKFYHNNLGVSLMKQSRHGKAYDAFQGAVEIDPRYAKALSNLAITCFYMARFNEAYRYYIRARDANSAYVDARFERNRVRKKVEEIQRQNPGSGDYKRIIDTLN
jgi:Flp pilus assembly protein TadD